MAYIIGIIDEKEEQELIRRGWEIEVPSEHLLEALGEMTQSKRYRMTWVDSSMYEVMDGPDWDKG
jgi:hypothetical protein